MDVDLVIAGLAARACSIRDHVAGAVDGRRRRTADPPLPEGVGCEIGGYMIAARRTDSWDAILAVLIALDADHHDCFHRVMRECRNLSNAGFELDGLDDLLGDDDQVMFDLTVDRERRREQRGYVAPGQGRAFLEMSRRLRLGPDSSPPRSPIARAYFQAIEDPADADSNTSGIDVSPGAAPTERDSAEAVAALVGALVAAGVLPQPPRALLEERTSRRRGSRAHPGAAAVRARPRPGRLCDAEPGARLRQTRSSPAVPSRHGRSRRRKRRMPRRDQQPRPGELAAPLAVARGTPR
jgi:hypothetical protein